MQLEMLFTPVSIGRIEIRNRVVMAPMVTLFAAMNGTVTQRLIDFYVARAEGGTGLIIVEAAYVQDDGKGWSNQLGIDRDDLVPGLRQLTSAIHAAGAKAAIQLHHAGRATHSSITGKTIVAASAISVGDSELPRELSVREIGVLVEAFGHAGRRAREAGFDAIEIHGAHGYLLQQFLSPHANKRTDLYGGDLERRLRLPTEVLHKIKQKAGADFPIIYRLNAEEVMGGGLSDEETRLSARYLVDAGADAIHASESSFPIALAPMEIGQGYIAHLAEGIREVVSVPVIAVGRITDPREAERILKDEQADMVAIGRGLLADPEWVAKAERGAFTEIRRCIACNEGCFARLMNAEPISCLCNPDVGREREYAIRKADQRKRVVVVGGGPAGMEAARVAALRGHEVTLYEQESYLGGKLTLASRVPGRNEFSSLIRYLTSQLREAGVKIELDFRANAAFVEDVAPDVLIIATGSVPVMPWTVVRWTPEAVTACDVLAGKENVGEKVLILGGGLVGFDAALFLAERRREVRVVEVLRGPEDHPMTEPTHASMLLDRLKERGVEIFSCTQVRNARDGVVTVSHEDREELISRYPLLRALRDKGFREFEERRDSTIRGFDTLVLALGSTPDQTMVDDLRRRRIPSVHIIGDAAKPRTAFEAIRQGAEVGRRV